MRVIKRPTTASIAFHKPTMLVDHICSNFPHINPYLALIGRVAAKELLEPQSFNEIIYIAPDVLQSISAKAVYNFVSQASWANSEEKLSLEQLSIAYLYLRRSPKHRLDQTYEHYICCQIGRSIISNQQFRIKLQSQCNQLKQELSDFEQLLLLKFQCTIEQVSLVAVDGLQMGALKVWMRDDLDCALCDSKLRLSVNSATTITRTRVANFIGRLSTIEDIQRSGKSGTVVDGEAYELIMDELSVDYIDICSYSHIYQLIEISSNVLIGNPYLGPNIQFAVGYLPHEKNILD